MQYEVVNQNKDRDAAFFYDTNRPFILFQTGTKRCIVNRYPTLELAHRAMRNTQKEREQ